MKLVLTYCEIRNALVIYLYIFLKSKVCTIYSKIINARIIFETKYLFNLVTRGKQSNNWNVQSYRKKLENEIFIQGIIGLFLESDKNLI